MNNNKLFDLNSFRKLKKNSYEKKENCEKNSGKWGKNYITNPKFSTFDHKNYTAGDYEDFNQYGILNSLYYLSKDENKINNNILKKSNNNIFKLYKNIDIESIINTFTYMFEKMKKGIFLIIHNNELVLFLPFSNYSYINNWYDKIYFSLEEKKLIDENDYERIQPTLRKNIIEFMNEHPEQFERGKRKIDFNRKKWHANNCVFRNQFPPYEGDLNIELFKDMIKDLCKNRKIPNVQFFINYRDSPILKKDLTEPYFHLFDSKNVKIESKFNFKKFAPILSQSITNDHADILIPTSDDWLINSSKIFTNKCSDTYTKNKFNDLNLNWKKKKNICVFRGSATGCGMTIDNNMRLKAAQLSIENPKILDAGITDWKPRDKKYTGQPIQIINPKDFKFDLSNSLTRQQQSDYKYILNIEGYVSAFRLSSELRMNSVVLICESEYKLWYSDLLVEYEHFVPVKKDLSNLIDQIKWCVKNDKKCEKIASNSLKFYEKYLTKEALYDYMQKVFVNIYLNRNLKNPLVIKKVKKNVAIIVCFRDPGNNSRNKQKDIFVKALSTIFQNIFDFHIFIIEQSSEGGFNIGKLKNIGYVEANKVGKFDHYIFSDVDMIPGYHLLKYYQKKPTNLICLAAQGTRYKNKSKIIYGGNNKMKDKPFTGGVISVTKKIFEKINGYPNNFRNWGGEDDSLLIRMVDSKLNKLEYPKIGGVIDIEKNNSGKSKKLLNKLNELKKNQSMEYQKYEKLVIDFEQWKNNGLNSLLYKSLKSKKLDSNTTQITVDLMYKEEEKKYNTLYPKKNNLSNNNYIKFKKDCLDKLFDYYNKIEIV